MNINNLSLDGWFGGKEVRISSCVCLREELSSCDPGDKYPRCHHHRQVVSHHGRSRWYVCGRSGRRWRLERTDQKDKGMYILIGKGELTHASPDSNHMYSQRRWSSKVEAHQG